ncbi:PPP2R2B isoform 19 [Pan troglodytes]|uniref:Protein phosphatase 2 regulatory subunit Bbeta n=3 Tax=Hominidae TaxID=9604 RepID=E5RFC4_HUMAN|nr:PPP2R2B isoform 19 [Pan troglodytes]PNJ59145.1 PPP2R2B isoform 5 [Pongo abelii]
MQNCSDHGAVPLAPLPPSPVRLAAGRDHGYLSAGFWFPRK